MQVDVSTQPTKATRVALAGALLMAAAMGIGRFAYTPLLPSLQETLAWNVSQAGDVASANFLGYMLGALAAATLAQRPDRRGWLLVGMLLSTATTCAGVILVSFPAWLAMRFVAGVASAFCLVLGTVVVMEYLAQHGRTSLGALHFSGVGDGVVVSVLVIELTRRSEPSVFAQWGALGLASLVLFAASWRMLRALPRQAVAHDTEHPSRQHTPTPHMLTKLIVAYGLFGFGYIVTATFIVAMVRRLDQAPLVEAFTWIVFGVSAAPSILPWQRLAQRFGMFPALRLAYAVEAVGVLLAGFGAGQAALVLGGALLGGTFVGITALGLSAARQIDRRNPDRAIGWMTASFGLGQLLGPAVAGRLAHSTQGFAVPSVLAASLLLVGIGLLQDGKHR